MNIQLARETQKLVQTAIKYDFINDDDLSKICRIVTAATTRKIAERRRKENVNEYES